MRQLYARVFTQILDSSLAENWQARHVFEDLLKLADDGLVDMTRPALARQTNIPLDVVNAAIDFLEAPDPASRDASEDGRRIVRLDDHRDWGWRIVNWGTYDAIRSKEDQRVKTRERVRRHRERLKGSPLTSPTKDTDADSDSDSDAEEALQKRYTPLQARPRPAGAGPTSRKGDDFDGWLVGVKADPAFAGIDVDRELAKMRRWCKEHKKEPTRKRFVNWLNRCDRPVSETATADHSKGF